MTKDAPKVIWAQPTQEWSIKVLDDDIMYIRYNLVAKMLMTSLASCLMVSKTNIRDLEKLGEDDMIGLANSLAMNSIRDYLNNFNE